MVKAIDFLEKIQKEEYSKHRFDLKKLQEKLSKPSAVVEDILSKQSGFISPEQIISMRTKIAKYYEDRNKIKLPTEYETHGNYELMLSLSANIESAIPKIAYIDSETGVKKTFKDLPNIIKPIFGTIPMGQINAASYGGFDNNEYLITFEWELFHFCNLLSKIVAKAIPFRKDAMGVTFLIDEKEVQQRINSERIILKRFLELIVAYLAKGRVTAAPQYNIEAPYTIFSAKIRHAMELFIMGHEYAHILLGHLENEGTTKKHLTAQDVYNVLFSWDQELEADSLGLPLMLSAMDSNGDHYLELNYCGAELFFSGYEILERAKCILRQGNDEWYWKGGKEDGPIGEHPPSERRRDNLRKMMIKNYGDDSVKTSILAEQIIRNLWEQTKPRLIHAYEDYTKSKQRTNINDTSIK